LDFYFGARTKPSTKHHWLQHRDKLVTNFVTATNWLRALLACS